MKLFSKMFVGLALAAAAIASPAVAQDQQTLFASQTFNVGSDIISADINNASNPKNAIRIFVTYEDLEPDICAPGFSALIEQEIAPGVWRVLASQNERIANQFVAPKRTIILEPTFVADPGNDLFVDDGNGGQRISIWDGTPGATLRLRIVDNGSPCTTITVSAYAELFDR